ncbi:hypothetical protein LSCM4_01103 [Leishmania orientalis]|uniref:Uncharacterized protein n=1 Tax=Leishmania orientalis TaxID=2249476 RepID=A0A836G4U3_9TRYP|nr:hypothetical protein LSCM4_01103 [Leishmania orientalis]
MMNGARRFSAAPVNFDRFIVLARSYSRSLSPDKELDQMLRPFQARETTTTSTATRESTVSRVRTPKPHRQQLGSDDVGIKELVVAQVLDRKPSWGNTRSFGTTRSTTADETLPSTRAATSASRSVSGSAAATPSIVFTGFSHSAYDGCCDGEETQELGQSSYSVGDVDPLLRAALQLGSPLYDPVKRQFVCWRLHALERRPRTAYGDVEGVSCDFCGHTDWREEGEREKAFLSVGASRVGANEEKDGAKPPLVAASSSSGPRFFYHCSTCLVDICRACLEEVRSDERFHIPCLECQRCGGCETRQNAPLHRCTELMVISDSDENEMSAGVPPLSAPPGSHAGASQTPPTTSPSLPPPAALARAPPKYKGVPVGNPVRLGLSRRHRQAVKGQAAADAVATAYTEKNAGSVSHSKRKRASPETAPSPKQRLKEEANEKAEMFPRGDVSDTACRQLQRVSGGAVSRPALSKQKEEYIEDGGASGAHLESTAPPLARYEVYITPRTMEEVSEVGRIAREQHLVSSTAPSLAKACVFYFATRLAAETCVDRATVASLEAVLKRTVKSVNRTCLSPLLD